MRKLALALITAVLMLVVLPACSHTTSTSTPTATRPAPGEPAYAGQITQVMLEAMNSGNYIIYSAPFSADMAQRVSESVFNDMVTFVKSKIGEFKSKKFDSTKYEGNKTEVVYKAKYSLASNVEVHVVFLASSDNMVSVDDLWLNAPELFAH